MNDTFEFMDACILGALAFFIFVLGLVIGAQQSIGHDELIKAGYGQYSVQTGDFELIPLKQHKEKK